MTSEENRTFDKEPDEQLDTLLTTPNLAGALESEQFRRFLDQVPIALVVAAMQGEERIVYANPEYEKLSGQSFSEIEGRPWSVLQGSEVGDDADRRLGAAIVEARDKVGSYAIEREGAQTVVVDAYSNIIEDDDGNRIFRLAALVCVRAFAEETSCRA